MAPPVVVLAAAGALAVLAPIWHLAGRAAQRLQLPAITGMMLVSCAHPGIAPLTTLPHVGPSLCFAALQMQVGIASGPQALGLLSPVGLQGLLAVQHLCLSVIALSAGAELHLPELRRLRKQVLPRCSCCAAVHGAEAERLGAVYNPS
jgi:hypothetical protein